MPESTYYVISVAAELSGMHPQTLRQYDRLGMVTPKRTSGRGRRYSLRDIERLREIQRLSNEEGINLAGISRILELEEKVARAYEKISLLEAENTLLRSENKQFMARIAAENRVFAASAAGSISEIRGGARPRRGRTASNTSAKGAEVILRKDVLREVLADPRRRAALVLWAAQNGAF